MNTTTNIELDDSNPHYYCSVHGRVEEGKIERHTAFNVHGASNDADQTGRMTFAELQSYSTTVSFAPCGVKDYDPIDRWRELDEIWLCNACGTKHEDEDEADGCCDD